MNDYPWKDGKGVVHDLEEVRGTSINGNGANVILGFRPRCGHRYQSYGRARGGVPTDMPITCIICLAKQHVG